MVGCAVGGHRGQMPNYFLQASRLLICGVPHSMLWSMCSKNIDLHVLMRPKTCGRVLDQKPGEPWRRVVTETKA